jgi:hypothetical protein
LAPASDEIWLSADFMRQMATYNFGAKEASELGIGIQVLGVDSKQVSDALALYFGKAQTSSLTGKP